jgi:hypothetical protein
MLHLFARAERAWSTVSFAAKAGLFVAALIALLVLAASPALAVVDDPNPFRWAK